MKLGIAYNVFDGVELLPYSIASVLSEVDFVCIVIQFKSNHGNKITNDDMANLDVATRLLFDNNKPYIVKGFISKLQEPPAFNELNKRNVGLRICKENGCTHFISADVDECYLAHELRYVKTTMELGGYDSSACQMVTYFKSPKYRLEPMETYFVPLIYKIDDRRFEKIEWPILVDPTRRMKTDALKGLRIFDRSEIQMHHYSYVRKNIRTKLENSSAKRNFVDNIDRLVEAYDNWKPGKKAIIASWHEYDTVKTDNLFNIDVWW